MKTGPAEELSRHVEHAVEVQFLIVAVITLGLVHNNPLYIHIRRFL